MRRAAGIGAGIAAIGTALVAVIALMGVPRLPVAELLLFPGSMAAWVYGGDTYSSGPEFLLYSVAFGVPLNAVFGAIIGMLVAALRSRSR
ncbi:MAG: hypothetical protein OEO79_07045 [Gemmatimonadota bacterium]|nr:hypothetical protein [Gemmatimonadota bacterium]MDH3421752.1 hypothetical protein [Gemmatimonadota bacterium]